MENNKLEWLAAIFILGFILTFLPKITDLLVPGPIPPPDVPIPLPISELEQAIKLTLTSDELANDARKIGSCLKSAANLFVLDTRREKPYYETLESRKWAIRRIDELTMGSGYLLKEKNPALAKLMAEFMEKECGEEPTPEKINNALLTLSVALEGI